MLRKIGESLRRKYGPLPLWAWTALAGGAVFLWNRLRAGPSEAASAEPAYAPAYAFGEAGEPDYGDTGAPAPVGGVAPAEGEPSTDLYPDNKLRLASMQLIDQIRGISDELGATSYAPELAGYEDVVAPDVPESIATPAKAATPAKGVKWGGQTFTTKAGLASWLQRHGGGSPAAAFAAWARRHPGGAKKLAGPAPKAPAKQPPRPAVKPSSRTAARAPAKGGNGAGGARARAPQPPTSQPARPRPAPARQAPAPAPKQKAAAPRKPAPAPRPKPKPAPARKVAPRRSGI